MKTTKQFLAELARKYPRPDGRPASDYGLAKLLGVSSSSLVNYQKHGGTMDDEVALRVAELLNVEPIKVLAAMQHERAKNADVKKVWAAVAVTVAAVAVTAGWFDYTNNGPLLPEPGQLVESRYYVNYRIVPFPPVVTL